jgi:hypothetical protein
MADFSIHNDKNLSIRNRLNSESENMLILQSITESYQKHIQDLHSIIHILKGDDNDKANTTKLIECTLSNYKNIHDGHTEHVNYEEKTSTRIKELMDTNECLKYEIKSLTQLIKNDTIEKETGVLCLLCEENQRNVLFKPCNHILICDSCSGKTDFQQCMVCKYDITDYEYAYLS